MYVSLAVLNLVWMFLYALLGLVICSDDEAYLTALKAAAGIYVDPSAHIATLNQSSLADIQHTVLITAFNYGYSNHLYNFHCLTQRMGLKVLVIALDPHAHEMAGKLANITSYLWKDSQSRVEEVSTRFRSPQFNLMSFIKLEAVMKAMAYNYHVIFADPDVAIVRDPTPHVFWQGIDYVHSHNKICPQCYDWNFFKSEEEGNTGFYFVRSNDRTIKLFSQVLKNAPNHPDLDDQSVFWLTLRQEATKSALEILPMPACSHLSDPLSNSTASASNQLTPIVTCALDGCMFAAGALRGVAYDWVRDNLQQRGNQLVTIHANYLKGNDLKAIALKKHGYWITQYPERYCHAYHPKYDM
jgi:hypothetical protein